MFKIRKLQISASVALTSMIVNGCGVPTGTSSENTESSVSSTTSSQVSSSVSSAQSSSVSVTPGSDWVYGINVGGVETTTQGNQYHRDTFARGGSVHSTTDDIEGTGSAELYQSERYGDFTYEIPVTNATYSVSLHFVEMYHEVEGNRLFNVTVEGQTVFTDIDLYADVGHDVAFNTVVNNIMVADESLTIEVTSSVDSGTLSAIGVYSNDGGEFVEPPPRSTTGHDFFIGNITTSGSVRSDFAQYWDQITPENEGKWGSVEGTRDQYNWGPVDRIYDFARQAGIPVKAHTLVWGAQAPGWINNLSPTEQAAEIEEWMRDYCNRYPDTLIIDVVNEAHPNHAPANYARSAFGDDWIKRSFELAREHCPDAILVYNDFNFMTWDTDEIMDIIRPAVSAGVVDAIGLQAHSLYDPKVWTVQEIEDKIDLISTLGLPIYISEYDIEATNDQQQLEYMQMHFPVFYNHPNVVGITFWGYIYGATWREGTGLIRQNGDLRPAMTWMLDYVRSNPK